MCKKTFVNFFTTLKQNKYFNIFNVIVLPLLCFLSIMTAWNGVKNYLRFDVVSQTRVIEQVCFVTWIHLSLFSLLDFYFPFKRYL